MQKSDLCKAKHKVYIDQIVLYQQNTMELKNVYSHALRCEKS